MKNVKRKGGSLTEWRGEHKKKKIDNLLKLKSSAAYMD